MRVSATVSVTTAVTAAVCVTATVTATVAAAISVTATVLLLLLLQLLLLLLLPGTDARLRYQQHGGLLADPSRERAQRVEPNDFAPWRCLVNRFKGS